ncbi:unnamed protein product [Phaeothamnion confervicola]
MRVSAAPLVIAPPATMRSVADPIRPGAAPLAKRGGKGQQEIVLYNPRADVMKAPVQGPAHPFKMEMAVPAGGRAVKNGVIEPSAMEDWSFHEQYHTYDRFGYAMDAGGRMVGSYDKYAERGGATVLSASEGELRRQRKRRARSDPAMEGLSAEEAAAARAAARSAAAAEEMEDLGDEASHGVWAPDMEPKTMTDLEAGTITEAQIKWRDEFNAEKARTKREFDEDEFTDRRDERKIGHLLPPRHDRDTQAPAATTQWHGGNVQKQRDYQGRSWIEPPAGMREGDGAQQQAFPPKKCIHRFTGHAKGVQAIEFFPGQGHLLLSGSMDGKVKIWDVYKDRGCRRTYTGHSAAVRDVRFSNDGRRFLSCGYDRFIRLWDTETGQVISTFTNRKMAYCVRFFPVDNDVILAGCSDNKVVQWDVSSGEVSQEYNHHLAPVNSVLFVDDNQKIVSTSDDKKVLIWEYNIPVPIKYIAEPHMHSMPATALHPSGNFWVGQSMDNQILTWGARDRFKQNRKKEFKGHINAGYACQMSFSPNGKFLASGDGQGKLFVWDWGSTKIYRKMDAHDNGPAISTAWHPREPSWVATAGWDGLIKLWD